VRASIAKAEEYWRANGDPKSAALLDQSRRLPDIAYSALVKFESDVDIESLPPNAKRAAYRQLLKTVTTALECV
jgi:hypothetical protein